MNCFSIWMSKKKNFILSLLFKRQRLPCWQFSPFSTIELSLHNVLVCIISKEKSASIFVFFSSGCNVSFFFSPSTFKISYLLLHLRNLTMICLSLVFFMFLVLRFHWDSWLCELIVFIKLGLFSQPVFSEILFFVLLPFRN